MAQNWISGSDLITMTPQLALVVAMAYISAADGQLAESEIADILRVVPDRQTLAAALRIIHDTEYSRFLDQAAEILSPAQMMCVLLNAIGIAWVDGTLASEEREKLNQMARSFGLEAPHQTYMEVFRTKAKVSVLL
jgi:tellurite resistance protein